MLNNDQLPNYGHVTAAPENCRTHYMAHLGEKFLFILYSIWSSNNHFLLTKMIVTQTIIFNVKVVFHSKFPIMICNWFTRMFVN